MKAYKFYWIDQRGVSNLIGILPERRVSPHRMTKEFILNWAKQILGEDSDVKDVYFVEVDL